MRKKIVFIINYFHPNYESIGQLFTELCLELQFTFDIIVISAQSNKRNNDKINPKLYVTDQLEQIQIIRVQCPELDKNKKWSRLRYISAYFFLSLIALMRLRNISTIYTVSQPPILGGLIGTIGKILKRAKHIYNIQDFNPEQAQAVSYTNQKWVYSLAKMIDKWNCQMCDHVITVGSDMQETLVNRFVGKKVPENSVINNWTNEVDIVPLHKSDPQVRGFLQKHELVDKFIIMYSGNLGLFYDLENIIRITEHFREETDIAFLFIGEGAVKKSMQRFIEEHGIRNTIFLPYQPKEFIKYSLNAADIHLVVNQKGLRGVSVPSKIYGIMASGKPILGMLEKGSEAQRIIEQSNAGFVVEPQDYNGIINEIRRLKNMSERQRFQIGTNGRIYLEMHFRKEISISKYRKLLESV